MQLSGNLSGPYLRVNRFAAARRYTADYFTRYHHDIQLFQLRLSDKSFKLKDKTERYYGKFLIQFRRLDRPRQVG